jgi:hypothetical protein
MLVVVGPCEAAPPVGGPNVFRPPELAGGFAAGVEGRDMGVDGCAAGLEKFVDGVCDGLDSGADGLNAGEDGLDTGADGVAAGLETGAGADGLGAGATGLAPGWLGCLSLSFWALARLHIPRSPAIRRAKEPFLMARQRSEVFIVSSFSFNGCSSPALLAGCVGACFISDAGGGAAISRPKGLHRVFWLSSDASAAENPFCME